MHKINPPATPQPLISIIIATYNAADVLAGCLQSIISQTEKRVELVIIDGGSTDGTLDMIKADAAHISHWVSEPDQGIYDAFNKGTCIATGKWFCFLGADDRLLPGFSAMAAKLIDEDTLYYGDPASDGKMLTGPFSNYRLAKYCLNHQTLFYPARVFQKYSYTDRYKIFADYDLNLKVWGDPSIKKQYYPITVVWYNLTGFSAGARDELFKRDKPLLIKKSMGWLMYLRFLYKRRKEQSKPGSNFY